MRSLTGAERDEFEQKCMDRRRKGQMDIRGLKIFLVILSVCDEAGVCLFTEKDAAALSAKSASAIERIFDVARRISHLTPEAVGELVGNSGGDLSGDSGSF